MCCAQCINAGFEVFVFYTNRLDRTWKEIRTQLPWGNSVISSAVTCPKRSRVAWTLELKPLVSLLPASAKLMLPMLDWSFDHPSIDFSLWGRGRYNLVVKVGGMAKRTFVTWPDLRFSGSVHLGLPSPNNLTTSIMIHRSAPLRQGF